MGRTRESANLVSDKNIFVDIANDLVGIGTTAPTVELEVAGNAKVSGIVTATTFSGNLSGGTLSATTGAFSGNVTLQANLDMQDNDKILLGTGDDLEIYHDGTRSYISDVGSGPLWILGNQIQIKDNNGTEDLAKFVKNAQVELYYDNSKKFETTSDGVTLTGRLSPAANDTYGLGQASLRWANLFLSGDLDMSDNDKIKLGSSDDLQIYHDGSNSFIKNSTGNLRIQDDNGNIQIQAKAGEESIIAKADGAVELYYNNSKKLETTSSGVTITGTATATSFSGDGSALSGVGGESDITSSLFS